MIALASIRAGIVPPVFEERQGFVVVALESISGADALAILKILAARDENLAQAIDAVAKQLFSRVEMDEVAANVQMELEALDVEEIWDRAGANRDGYVDPGEAALEMLEEALQPFRDEVDKYKQLSMLREADVACQGILKGTYDFHTKSSTEYEQWAADVPSEYFGAVLDAWKKLFAGRPPFPRMAAFLHTHCPDWAEWATKSLRSRRP
ncbi:MAG: hypothetical protein HY017_14080 [Betaproteobacteria bacterium]|nr:hypothetical protein [Betaproteobacteria bacterium]